ncbi:NMD3-related protein [Archaeoglobus sp.]
MVQIRDVEKSKLEGIVSRACKFNAEIERVKNGVDIYFEDVNDARRFISVLKKLSNFEVKFSTKFAGLRKGRVRVLFVYCLRYRG